jgi:hypothetical protein
MARWRIFWHLGKLAFGKMVILRANGFQELKSNPAMDIKNKFSFMKKKRVITKVKEITDVIYSFKQNQSE